MNIDEKLKEYRQKVNQIQATQTESRNRFCLIFEVCMIRTH